MLYDHFTGPVTELPVTDLAPADIEGFCADMGLKFFCINQAQFGPVTEVFRTATRDVPARGITMAFERVRQWKRAKAQMQERVYAGGRYLHYKGGRYVTVCRGTIEATGIPAVVYRGQDGRIWIRPEEDFFGFVHLKDATRDELVPRFSLQEPESVGAGDE